MPCYYALLSANMSCYYVYSCSSRRAWLNNESATCRIAIGVFHVFHVNRTLCFIIFFSMQQNMLTDYVDMEQMKNTKYFCIYSPNFLSFWANLEGIPLGTPLARRGASKRHPSCNSARTRLVMQSTWFENKAPSARASHCLPKVLLSRVSWLHGWLCAGWLLATMVFWPEMQVKSV